MVVEQYDSFLDPKNWPGPDEIEAVRKLYGWDVEALRGESLPTPSAPSGGRRKPRHGKSATGL